MGAVERLNAAEASARLGEPTGAGALAMAEALVIEPSVLTEGWLAGAPWRQEAVAGVVRAGEGWSLRDADGHEIGAADVVCLANGVDAARLAPDLPLSPVRGQISIVLSADAPSPAIWGGYLIPSRDGYVFGATHDRGEIGDTVRREDHDRNRIQLAETRPELAAGIDPDHLGGRAGVRAVTPDFLPLAGAVPGQVDGLFVLSGLGSRGFCAAPLLAEHVAALATGSPSPLPAALAAIVDPGRFEMRRTRRLARLRVKSAT